MNWMRSMWERLFTATGNGSQCTNDERWIETKRHADASLLRSEQSIRRLRDRDAYFPLADYVRRDPPRERAT